MRRYEVRPRPSAAPVVTQRVAPQAEHQRHLRVYAWAKFAPDGGVEALLQVSICDSGSQLQTTSRQELPEGAHK